MPNAALISRLKSLQQALAGSLSSTSNSFLKQMNYFHFKTALGAYITNGVNQERKRKNSL